MSERRGRRRLALHRAGQAAAEWLHRKLQRPAARRASQRDAVPVAASRPRRARSLAARLQRGATALQAGWMTPGNYARAIIQTAGRTAAQPDGSALRPLETAIADGSEHERTLATAG
jgi:hypothetical protein